MKKIEETRTTNKLVDLIQHISFQLGIPRRLISDGALEFHLMNTILTPALARLGIKHTLMSEYKPSSNGNSESSVNVLKTLLKKAKLSGECVKIMLFLLNNVCRDHGLSPADLIGRIPQSIYLELPKEVVVENMII